MQFDTLNELLTSTVFDLFTVNESMMYEPREIVRELQVLMGQNSNVQAHNEPSHLGDSTLQEQLAISFNRNIRTFRSVTEWIEIEAPRRLTESFKKLALQPSLLTSDRRTELERYLLAMSEDQLTNEKKKVKNQLRCYDNDFETSFKRQPNHREKEPFRPLYGYYKKLKEHITRRGIQEVSVERIDQMIRNIRAERRELRDRIQNYQNQFEKTNNRKIRYLRDIAPIEQEYRKYKELRNQLMRYEDLRKNDQ